MKIRVGNVEGKTSKGGSKQHRLYTVDLESSTYDDGSRRVPGFYDAVSDTGKKFTIWNVKGDWSRIGIARSSYICRYTYTSDFEIIEN